MMGRMSSKPPQKVALWLGGAVTLGLVVTVACGGSDCNESFTCAPADEGLGGQGGAGGAPSCDEDNGGCHEQATCSVDGGAVQCTCAEGYAGDGLECADVDECAEDNGGCDENATCTNVPGSRTCACDEGFHGDGESCRPLTELITVGLDGAAANGDSWAPCFSANGRYLVFNSNASNLVEGDTNGDTDVFRYDLEERTFVRVSVNNSGNQVAGVSTASPYASCSVSADGRYVAFSSNAVNLVSNDSNGVRDVFLRDIEDGTTVRMSVASGGIQATGGESVAPVLSADGRRLLFRSSATNLGAGEGESVNRVYLRDLAGAQNELVSLFPHGSVGAYRIAMNGDGTMIAWDTAASFNASDTGADFDVFLRSSGVTTLVSYVHGDTSVAAGGSSRYPVLTADGRFIAFQSEATALLPPGQDTNGSVDVFLRNLTDGTLERISLSAISTQVTGDSTFPSLSADARYVLFHSVSSELVAGDSNDVADVFLRDRIAESTIRVSVGSKGEQADGPAVANSLALSSDGSKAAFGSQASNLAPGVTGGWQQLYLRTLPAPAEEASDE